MVIEVLKCKQCGTVMVIDINKLWSAKACSTCESTDIEIFKADEDEVIG